MGFGDVVDANRLGTLVRLRSGQFFKLIGPLLIVVLAGAAFGAGVAIRLQRSVLVLSVIFAVVGAAIAIASVVIGFFSYCSQTARRLQASGPTTFSVTDQGLRIETPNAALRPWSAFLGYVDAPSRILLLYPSQGLFNISKAGLSAVTVQQLLGIISRNLRPL
jgi:hypothetical protein